MQQMNHPGNQDSFFSLSLSLVLVCAGPVERGILPHPMENAPEITAIGTPELRQ